MRHAARAALLLTFIASLAACGGGGTGSEDETDTVTEPPSDSSQQNPPQVPPGNTPPPPPTPPGGQTPSDPPHWTPPPPPIDPPPDDPEHRGFTTVNDETWDDTAVRKVLHTFALGGQATDEQIRTWADMSPRSAITEMLTFGEHNAKLSPVGPEDLDRLDTRDGTLYGLSAFWSSDDPANGVPEERRDLFVINDRLAEIWAKAATSRGLNPFRHRIGLWETNYHLAVNLDAGVNRAQIARYYEDILAALAAGSPYQDVLTTAALSAAVATQYGHRHNVYSNGACECNEDFAREYFQLFFGILGEDDPSYHETVTIKDMAAALTDMEVPSEDSHLLDYVIFGTANHYPGTLDILHEQIDGTTARERVEALSPLAIQYPESLDNLPVMIVSGLADDAMTETKAKQIREAWADMAQKDLLEFLRDYAVSTLFHKSDRTKFWTSPERHLIITNVITVKNEEGDLDLYNVDGFEADGVKVFEPLHNVFGNQSGEDAADSSDVIRSHLNRVMDDEWRYRRGSVEKYGTTWTKDWSALVPRTGNGTYVVRDVAAWLWQRFIADGLKNFGALEQAYTYALLATDSDFNELAAPNDLDHVFTSEELANDDDLAALIESLAGETMQLDSADAEDRLEAHERLGQAINFIAGTPYVFAEEGR
jgi:hypothetical protein